MTRSIVSRDRLIAGIGAGMVAGLTGAAFAAFYQLRTHQPVSGTYRFIASAAGGTGIEATPWAVPAGVLILFVLAILWAFAYLTAAGAQSQLLSRPLISGAGFGVIVWFVMQAVLVGAGHFTPPTIYTFDRDMVGYIIFFGIPLTLTAARLMPAR